MTIERAIMTAIEYEARVRDLYAAGKEALQDETARHVLDVLCLEETWHHEYLEKSLEEWKRTGRVSAEELKTALPSRRVIERSVKALQKRMRPAEVDVRAELDLLKRALIVEAESSAFYRKMVSELSGEGQALFERFVEIEEGHLALVAAEIDSVSGLGFWFDTQEFNLEAG